MIFFSIPSVGQIKPETLFSSDDHFGFIQTLIGEKYVNKEIGEKCAIYYSKKDGVKYWDRLITIVNFLGLKKLDQNNKFCNIPLLDFIVNKFDAGDLKPSEILFDYLLCEWQYPHPIVTKNSSLNIESLGLVIEKPRSNYNITKPYAIILSILKELYSVSPKKAYFSNEEFYWLGYNFYKNKGENFSILEIKELTASILEIRKDGWKDYSKIKNLSKTKTHLNYPRRFLKNSSILTDEKAYFDSDDVFIGLKDINSIISKTDSLIAASLDTFEFDRKKSIRDQKLSFEYSNYLYNPERISKWLSTVEIYDEEKGIFEIEQIQKKDFNDNESEIYKVTSLLCRLSNLERESITKNRTEQYILRNYLLKNDYGLCAICNKEYPIKFLATAHIKKRSECSDAEKRNINIVMPTCYLGCDKLYEEGYVIVENGLIKSNIGIKKTTKMIDEYLLTLSNNKCEYYKKDTAKYFKHHAKKNI